MAAAGSGSAGRRGAWRSLTEPPERRCCCGWLAVFGNPGGRTYTIATGGFASDQESSRGGQQPRPADTVAAPKTDPDAGHHAASTPESQSCASGRAISAGVRRQVWQRDGGRCSYVDPQTGRRCNSTHLIDYPGARSEAISASGGLNRPAAEFRRQHGFDGLQLFGRIHAQVDLGGAHIAVPQPQRHLADVLLAGAR